MINYSYKFKRDGDNFEKEIKEDFCLEYANYYGSKCSRFNSCLCSSYVEKNLLIKLLLV